MMSGRGRQRRAVAPSAIARPVFLLTDFGLQDTYVGVMKAVLRGLAPQITIDDLSHQLPPQDLSAAAFQLFTALPWLPAGSLTVVVVDPGVGSDRRLVLHRWVSSTRRRGAADERLLLSPDNGIVAQAFGFLAALGPQPAPSVARFELTEATMAAQVPDAFVARPAWGRTFDGRDRFAPLAALLATQPLPTMWPTAARQPVLPVPPAADCLPQPRGRSWRGRILQCDRFGNAVTNFSLHRWPATRPLWKFGLLQWQLRWHGRSIPLVGCYQEAAGRGPVALVGSSGLIELAIPNGSFQRWAGRRLQQPTGRQVELRPIG